MKLTHVLAAGALLFGAPACERTTEIIPTSYIAILTKLDDPAVGAGARYAYHVRELSGTLGIDTTVIVPATDTVILEVPAATYAISLDSLPGTCTARHGREQLVVVPEGAVTSIARYFIDCRASLTLAAMTEGLFMDASYVWRLEGPDGVRTGLLGASDSLRLERLVPGAYTARLQHVAPNCVVVSDGGSERSVAVDSAGGQHLTFRIACSDVAAQPAIVRWAASHHGGSAAVIFHATDPNRDLERYWFDITDCSGLSLLPEGARLRRGLSAGRTARLDSATVIGAFDTGLSDETVAGKCAALRVADEYGNTTRILEQPLAPQPGSAPLATSFNASLLGTTALRTLIVAADVDGDLLGVFGWVRARDGALAPADGRFDIGILGSTGYLETRLPDVALGGLLEYTDLYAVVVFVVDARGHFLRLEDQDVFR